VYSTGATVAGVGTQVNALGTIFSTSTRKLMPPPGRMKAGAPPMVSLASPAWIAFDSLTG